MEHRPVTLLLADDQPLFRAARRQAVLQAVPHASLHEAADAASLRATAQSHPATDLVLLDLMMPGSRSFAELAWLRSQFPGNAVIVVSASENVPVLAAARAGSDAANAARQLAARLASLTPQQFRVLELLALGKLDKQIAAELGISEQTTKAHVSATLAKLHVRNRTQASLLYRELAIDDTDQVSLER